MDEVEGLFIVLQVLRMDSSCSQIMDWASALVLSKSFDDGVSKPVEDIDWDALTVKGTCQEIEKRYLRLTSAPDPATVRPEEILEKALLMVQNSQKKYARLALEVGSCGPACCWCHTTDIIAS
ncbi:hypothetical protein KIW84_035203 [Lathyrus oleraceus]|uniref:Uncharacterized protein n=1 Tax=Pisum sativum TaxID=3888 RepID=A0A9D4Y602_PEA|nr:hypothetical protein KIW84_035203 [Pisum sativum]